METRCNYLTLAEFYESCLEKHGATPHGVDWPKVEDVSTRFQVMLELFAHDEEPIQLLDLGCGYGALVDFLSGHKKKITYTGLDVSPKMIQTAQNLHAEQTFFVRDILQMPLPTESYDYVIMNGLLTEKRTLAYQEMLDFAQRIIKQAYACARKGIAFNVMSYQVDWCDNNLFYWSFDALTAFLVETCSRHFCMRHDYGLYEYTIHLYKKPKCRT